MLANFQNVAKHYSGRTVLDGVSFQLYAGRKIGLVGPNGSGKTTVLRILTGSVNPDAGNAAIVRGVRLGYVPQQPEYDDAKSVLDCVLSEHDRLAEELHAAEEALSEAPQDEMERAMRSYQAARDAYDHIQGDHYRANAEAMLDALGLGGRMEQTAGSLSGGEKNVLALAEALLAEPDLLLLDEPANHLDYMAIAWLEDFLQRFKGAVLVVSHNRYLLDRVVDGILHLEGGKLEEYSGNYSDYRATRLRRLISQQQDYVANQKRLARLEALVRRLADKAGRADPKVGKQLKARRKQLDRERAEAVDRPDMHVTAIRPDFSTDATKANIALQLRGYSKSFGDLKLFEDAEMDIECGERVALVGPNGCGKTTLLRDVVKLGDWGNPNIRVGPSLNIGYCAQHQEVFHANQTVLDALTMSTRIGRGDAHGILARFLFTDTDLRKKVKNLSGGERNRLQLARLMVLRPNLLILDEPTNHLDIPAREAIEEALAEFEGTILVVSHDRYFLDKVASRVVSVENAKLRSYSGGFTDFWLKRRVMLDRSGRVATRGKARSGSTGQDRRLTEMEQRIAGLEREKAELEERARQALSRHDRNAARTAMRQAQNIDARLETLYEAWLAAAQ